MHAKIRDAGAKHPHASSVDDEAASRDLNLFRISARGPQTRQAGGSESWRGFRPCGLDSNASDAGLAPSGKSARSLNHEWLRCRPRCATESNQAQLVRFAWNVMPSRSMTARKPRACRRWITSLGAIIVFFHLFSATAADLLRSQSPGGIRKPFSAAAHDSAHAALNRHISKLRSIADDDIERTKLEGHLSQLKSMANEEPELWSATQRRRDQALEARMGRLNLEHGAAFRSPTPDSVADLSTTTPCATPERRRPLRGVGFEEDAFLSETSPCRAQHPAGVSARRAGVRAVVCLDFDMTLSAEHLHNLCESSRTGMAGVDVVKAFGGPHRIERLSHFLAELRQRGAALFIVSRGCRSRILQALHMAGLHAAFAPEQVLGWEELRVAGHGDKRRCARELGRAYGVSHERVVLVDDDEEQLWGLDWDEAASRPQGFQGYWVESSRGLTPSDMAAIVALVDPPCSPQAPGRRHPSGDSPLGMPRQRGCMDGVAVSQW